MNRIVYHVHILFGFFEQKILTKRGEKRRGKDMEKRRKGREKNQENDLGKWKKKIMIRLLIENGNKI